MIVRTNRIKQKLAAGQYPLGAFIQMHNPEVVEVAGHAGYDYVWLDCEHGTFGIESAIQMIRAAEATGMTAIVRVPSNDPSAIMHALDGGAMGVIVPQINTAEQARAAVAAAKYQVGDNAYGSRGSCPLVRAAGHQAPDWKTFARWSNENTLVWLLVETVEGLRNIEAIAQVPGVDAIVLGAFDLSVTMGHDGDRHHPEVEAALAGQIEKARRHGVDVVGLLFDPDVKSMNEMKRAYIKQGCRIFIAGVDRRILVNAFNQIYKEVSETK